MGTYYDIVCPEHKAVLRLWKTESLRMKLEQMVNEGRLSEEMFAPCSAYTNFIVVTQDAFKFVTKERPKARLWLQNHKLCKLFFLDSERADTFNYYEGFAKTDTL